MRCSVTATGWVLGGAVLLAQANGPLTQMSMPTVSRSTIVRNVVPAWVALPSSARILTSEGLDLRPLRNSAATDEHTRVGVLVGALSNVGRCARQVRAFLQYTDHQWRPIGDAIESEARVSDVAPGGVLPYRFRLKRNDDFDQRPAAYQLQVVEDGKPAASLQWVTPGTRVDPSPCTPPDVRVTAVVGKSTATWKGYRVTGRLTVEDGGPLRPDAVTITALLRDAEGQVLDVLVGTPTADRSTAAGVVHRGGSLPFTLTTPLPLGTSVASTTLFTDVLPGASAAGSPAR